jgi:transcriptional regulator with PAS, ATPase and Fis domain
MGKHKKLIVFSSDKQVKKYLVNTLNDVIGAEVEIIGCSLDEGVNVIDEDVPVLTSGEFLSHVAAQLFKNSKIISSKRVITGYNLEKVMMLPKGKSILVVNHPRATSEETIESLMSLGIDHLNYVPYWKGRKVDFDQIDTAVSPGMIHLCPGGIKNKIDIGPRTISAYTFLRILIELDLDLNYLERFTTYYNNLLLEASREMVTMHEQSELLRKNQEAILDVIDEGIVCVDSDNKIIFANRSIGKLLNMRLDLLQGRDFNDIYFKFKELKTVCGRTQEPSRFSSIYSYNGKNILVNVVPVASSMAKNKIYSFREVSKIQRLEETVRLKLSEKGYIAKYSFDDIWSQSRNINMLKQKAKNFARTDKNILIIGESGTGKELFAHAIHRDSSRANGPFVAINFAAIPENLVESELFGYEEGAFTGAKRGGKQGLFEQAHGGSIFLDEIGDAPLSVQMRLLRVLQEKEIMRVGGEKIIPVDVRIIAATNKNLAESVEKKQFREDLFYRLNVLSLEIPPLRQRKDDIPYLLLKYLKNTYNIEKFIETRALKALMNHKFNGNVRELINVAEYLCYSTADNNLIKYDDLPNSLKTNDENNCNLKEDENVSNLIIELRKSDLDLMVIYNILKVLEERGGIGVGRNWIKSKISERGISLSEGKVKRYQKVMNEHGLVSVGVKRQGTVITEKGRKICLFLGGSYGA